MPRKKKVVLEDLPTTVTDDDGVEREIGKVYFEKFTYEGHSDVFMLFRAPDDGHIIRSICRRDVREMLTDWYRDLEEDWLRNRKKHTDDPPAEG